MGAAQVLPDGEEPDVVVSRVYPTTHSISARSRSSGPCAWISRQAQILAFFGRLPDTLFLDRADRAP